MTRQDMNKPAVRKTGVSRTKQYDIRVRHQMRQRKKRRIRTLLRTMLCAFLIGAVICAVLFLSPWFNVSEINVSGNEKVSVVDIINASGIIKGKNTFKSNMNKSGEQIMHLPYIKTAEVKRKFPAKIEINVTESSMTGCINYAGSFICFDEDMEVVEYTEAQPPVFLLSGTEPVSYEMGKKLDLGDESKTEVLNTLIDGFIGEGILSHITAVETDNVLNVKFVYDNRLTVLCGDCSNFERKLLTFMEIQQNQLQSNAKGEIDLRVDGKSYYRP